MAVVERPFNRRNQENAKERTTEETSGTERNRHQSTNYSGKGDILQILRYVR